MSEYTPEEERQAAIAKAVLMGKEPVEGRDYDVMPLREKAEQSPHFVSVMENEKEWQRILSRRDATIKELVELLKRIDALCMDESIDDRGRGGIRERIIFEIEDSAALAQSATGEK